MKQVAVILLLVAAIVATIYNNERTPVAADSAPAFDRKLELVEEDTLLTPSLRTSVVVEEPVPVAEEATIVEEPVVVEEPAVVETPAEPVVEEELVETAVAEAIKVTTEAAPVDPVDAEEAAEDGEGRHLVGPETAGGADGDPHFKTWKNEHFEYHGQCDMVLVKDPNFANGLGIDVHIRTKLVRYWSYIQAVTIRIGNDIIELHGSSAEYDPEVHYWFNYEFQDEVVSLAGFPVTLTNKKTKSHKTSITIDLSSISPGQKIVVKTFKEFLKVDFHEPSAQVFGNVVGMLGDFNTGKTLSRDGATVIDDFTDLGHEWQVLPADGRLFHDTSEPQYPAMCIDPEDPRGDRQRRLDESSIKEEDAEAACAGLKDPLDRKDCVYDILATQDLDMVGAF